MTQNNSDVGFSSFPNKNIPESQKDEDYYRKCVKSIMSTSLGTSYPELRDRILLSQSYFNGTQSADDFEYVTSGGLSGGKKVANGNGNSGKETEDRVLGAQWRNYNHIRNIVKKPDRFSDCQGL